MTQHEEQLELQAYLDGELDEARARAVAARLARDQQAASLLRELRLTRQALAAGEVVRPLPETREFYWSKIQRELDRLEAPATRPVRESFALRLRRFLLPASGVALVAGLGVAVARWHGAGYTGGTETALDDSGALTYHDYSAGATLVWVSYPAEEELAQDDEIGTVE